jgi:hypothetical protein
MQLQQVNRTQHVIYLALLTPTTIKHSVSFTFGKVINRQQHQKQAGVTYTNDLRFS